MAGPTGPAVGRPRTSSDPAIHAFKASPPAPEPPSSLNCRWRFDPNQYQRHDGRVVLFAHLRREKKCIGIF